jgi:hypothetical protein
MPIKYIMTKLTKHLSSKYVAWALPILSLGLLGFFSPETSSRLEDPLSLAASRCQQQNPSGRQIYDDDFSWSYTFEETKDLFNNMYNSGKRLPRSIYYSQEKQAFVMPLTKGSEEIIVSNGFLKGIIAHVEKAMAKGNADYIFLADMGHGHFFLPKATYEAELNTKTFSHGDYAKRVFEIATSEPDVLVLYHTAEMFLYLGPSEGLSKLPAWERHRNLTRNLVGDLTNDANVRVIPWEDTESPVINSIPGYEKVGPDIDISASVDGCFPFSVNGKTQYFDISRFSPAPNPQRVIAQDDQNSGEFAYP